MDIREYGAAAVEGLRSLLGAAARWPRNPLRSPVNRAMWGRWWPAGLALPAIAVLAADAALPPLASLASRTPLAMPLAFMPRVVRELFISMPALFAFVVAWRVRSLRSSDPDRWTAERGRTADFGTAFFDAGAVPVAAAALLLAVGSFALDELAVLRGEVEAARPEAFGATVLGVALIAGILGVHRTLGAGFGKLLGAGLFVWVVHMAIGFTVPHLSSWVGYLPLIGRYAPQRTEDWALLLFDLAVACVAWSAARERFRDNPLWSDPPRPAAPPPPPPPPPPQAPPP